LQFRFAFRPSQAVNIRVLEFRSLDLALRAARLNPLRSLDLT
jgi:hypothetical protein